MNNEELEKQNKNLKEDFKRHIDRINELTNRINKAIEYIDRRDIDWGSEQHDKLVNILKGSDKE